MKSIKSFVTTFAIMFFSTGLFAGEVYKPFGCEYSVTFPNGFKPRNTSLGGVQALGAAIGTGGGNTRFAVECWPNDGQLTLEDFASGVEKSAQDRKLEVLSVVTEEDAGLGGKVFVSGWGMVDSTKIFYKQIIFVGERSRLDVTIVDSVLVSKKHTEFMKSIRRR